GYHDTRPNGSQTWRPRSWSMKRPTRVPASSVVRMKSASNMMAKWYQRAIASDPPKRPVNSCAMPTARLGAPPVRESNEVSPTCDARCCMADRARVGLPFQELGRGARRNERVEAGDGAAGDGDEREGEDLAGEDGPGAVDEPGEGRHAERRQDDDDA